MDNNAIIEKFKKLICLHRTQLNKASAENGLYYGQLPILEYIRSNGGCTQTEIATAMNVTASSIATSVKRMENAGLIVKATDSSDMRYNRLEISKKGIERSRECKKKFNEIDLNMFGVLTEEEQKIFTVCLEKMMDSLKI